MRKNWLFRIHLLLAISLLTGCGRKDSSMNPDHGTMAKGRFVEEEVQVPSDLQKNRYLDSFEDGDNLEILSYSKERDQYDIYTFDGDEWKNVNLDFKETAKTITITGLAKNAVHERYFYGYDDNNENYILSATGNSPVILQSEWNGPAADDMRIDNVLFHADGRILISFQDKALLVSEEGAVMHEFHQDYSPGGVRRSAILSDTEYITIFNQKIVSYSLDHGEPRELITEQNFDISNCMFADEEGSIYLASREGLYHIYDNSTIVEKVIDGTFNSMSLQSEQIRDFFKREQEHYYCVMSSSVDGYTSIYRYIYNPDLPALPQNSVTVYSLNDSPTLRQAAALMQRYDPNIRVEIRIASGERFDELSEDMIRAFNAELLNGGGADVLILDGLPKESYKEKDLLVNLNDLFDTIQKETPLLSNITKKYMDSQEPVYYLPVRFSMPVIFGDKNDMQSLFLTASGETDDFPTLAVDNYGNLERLLFCLSYNQVFPAKDGELSEEGLKTYLKNVKKLGEKVHAKVEFSSADMNSMEVDNQVSGIGNRRNGPVAFAQEKTKVGFENFRSIQDSLLTFGALEGKPVELESINGIFFPKLNVGINKNSKNQEAAKKFIEILFSPDLQNQDLSDGFGVLDDAARYWETVERDTKMIISDYDGSTILSVSWPKKEKRIQVMELIRSLTSPVDVDPAILNIITEYAKSYYDGSQDLDAVTDLIMNKIALYQME